MGAGGARGRARGRGARGLSQPLSQCKHVLIEIRSSGYNSFADVAARPPLSFSLRRTPNAVPYPYEVSLSGPRRVVVLALFLKRLASRDCASLAVAFHWLRGFAPSSITHFPFRGKEGPSRSLVSYPETGQSRVTILKMTGNYV